MQITIHTGVPLFQILVKSISLDHKALFKLNNIKTNQIKYDIRITTSLKLPSLSFLTTCCTNLKDQNNKVIAVLLWICPKNFQSNLINDLDKSGNRKPVRIFKENFGAITTRVLNVNGLCLTTSDRHIVFEKWLKLCKKAKMVSNNVFFKLILQNYIFIGFVNSFSC